MRSLVFEASTWEAYEKMREKDKKLHKALCKLLKEMLRSDARLTVRIFDGGFCAVLCAGSVPEKTATNRKPTKFSLRNNLFTEHGRPSAASAGLPPV